MPFIAYSGTCLFLSGQLNDYSVIFQLVGHMTMARLKPGHGKNGKEAAELKNICNFRIAKFYPNINCSKKVCQFQHFVNCNKSENYMKLCTSLPFDLQIHLAYYFIVTIDAHSTWGENKLIGCMGLTCIQLGYY